MQETLFVWLGSKRAKKRGVGERGVLLDLAARAGLPVPGGGILLDDFYRLALEDKLLLVTNGRVTCPDPVSLHTALYEEVRFPKVEKPVAVRAIFSPMEGVLPVQCPVNLLVPAQLAHSLCELYSAAQAPTQIERWDVLVMEMMEVAVEGTAVTSSTQLTIHISYENQTLTLPPLRTWQRPAANVPHFAQRLQKLLRGIRRTFGQGNWHIEWADDGNICWLLQISAL